MNASATKPALHRTAVHRQDAAIEERFIPRNTRNEGEVFAAETPLRMTAITQPRMAVLQSRSEDRPLHKRKKRAGAGIGKTKIHPQKSRVGAPAKGKWRVASGEWRVASGEWRVAS